MPVAPAAIDVARQVQEVGRGVREQMARRIVGLDDVVEQVMLTLLTRSHGLLEGVPGLAKTMLLSSMAELFELSFARIQFTPDLMPSDVTGSEYLVHDVETGARTFRFAKGPVFANFVLADEINRAPPKTQAALMEAMEEGQVTSLGTSRRLDDPFVVLATQNPIEQEGTYPLPVGQLDRFLFKVHLGYPTFDQEARIARLTAGHEPAVLERILDREALVALADAVAAVPVPPHVLRHAVELTQATRPTSGTAPAGAKEYVAWGAGPRAAQALVIGARARACLDGRGQPTVDDVRALVPAVFRHRLVLTYAAEADAMDPDAVIRELLETVQPAGRKALSTDRSWLQRAWTALWRPAPTRSRRSA